MLPAGSSMRSSSCRKRHTVATLRSFTCTSPSAAIGCSVNCPRHASVPPVVRRALTMWSPRWPGSVERSFSSKLTGSIWAWAGVGSERSVIAIRPRATPRWYSNRRGGGSSFGGAFWSGGTRRFASLTRLSSPAGSISRSMRGPSSDTSFTVHAQRNRLLVSRSTNRRSKANTGRSSCSRSWKPFTSAVNRKGLMRTSATAAFALSRSPAKRGISRLTR